MKKTKDFKKPTPRQLPSGSWFCRVRVDGKDIPITRDTPEEAVAEAMAVKYGIIEAKSGAGRHKTLAAAIDDYIERRRDSASPSTLYNYRLYRRNCFQSMMQRDIYHVTDEQWQAAIRREKQGKSPKYIANVWGLISAAVAEETGRRPNVKLPAKEHNERPFLDPDQIRVFVDAIKGSNVEIPALLELCSLRRSEMLALRWEDVDFQHMLIRIHSAMVPSENGMVHKKQNKTEKSARTIPIIPPLYDALTRADRRDDYVVTLSGSCIMRSINRICREAGLPEVGNHGLRHSFASLAYSLRIPDKIAMQIGGWSDYQTMRNIYTHLSQRDIAASAASFSNFFAPNAVATALPKSQQQDVQP